MTLEQAKTEQQAKNKVNPPAYIFHNITTNEYFISDLDLRDVFIKLVLFDKNGNIKEK